MILYKTSKYSTEIEEVEVTKETEHSVHLPAKDGDRARREAKNSGYSNYHNTKKEAKEFLQRNLEQKFQWLETELIKLKKDLETINAIEL